MELNHPVLKINTQKAHSLLDRAMLKGSPFDTESLTSVKKAHESSPEKGP